MPEMDGFELAQEIRLDPRLTKIPILFYSATYKESSAADLAQACGVSERLDKPADPEAILLAVKKALGAPPSAMRNNPYLLAEEQTHLLSQKVATQIQELEEKQRQLEEEIARRQGVAGKRSRPRINFSFYGTARRCCATFTGRSADRSGSPGRVACISRG